MSDSGYFKFAEKSHHDKYDDADYVQQYVAYAYGYRFLNVAGGGRFVGSGQSEALYRCIAQVALQEILERRLYQRESDVRVLDMACGVGRNLADLAAYLPEALVVGFDLSSAMMDCARKILLGSGLLRVDLERIGFGSPSISCFGLANVFLAQADASRPPLRSGPDPLPGFDLVINNMLVDRITPCERVEPCFERGVLNLKSGGVLIFACPFNWASVEGWQKYGRSRLRVLEILESYGLVIEEAFDGLTYKEILDPHGAHLELPVLLAKCRKPFR